MLRAKNIWVMGGDPRQAALAALLADDGHSVHTYALEQGAGMKCEPSTAGADRADCVILPLPAAGPDGRLNAPLAAEGQKVYLIIDSQSPEETLQLLGRLGDHQATFLLTAEELEQADLVRALVAGGHGLALQTRGETEAEMEEEIVRARELVWQAACAWLELVWCGDGAEELLSQLGCVRVTAQISASGDLDRAGQAAALMRAVSRYREDVSLSLGGDGSGLGGLGALLEDLDAGGYRLSAWRLTA